MSARFTFADSWWGQAWVDALEGSARLDPNRLGRGRSYARHGAVGPLMIDRGRVRARVAGSNGHTYQTEIDVRTIPDPAWDGVADAIAARAAHAAALADGELDPAIVDDVRSAGVSLLPGPGDLRPHCTCPDWAEPCKHAAAVCYLVAEELDRDPFLLFELRGLRRDVLRSMLAERRPGASPDAGTPSSRGVVAEAAWQGHALDEPIAPLPSDLARHLATPARPTWPVPWDVVVPGGDAVDPRRIDDVAADASERAWAMLADGASSGLHAGPRADLARRASALGPRELATLGTRVKLSTATLTAWVEAWRMGGDSAVGVVADEDSWSIDQVRLAAGRDELVALGIPKRSVALNYDSLGMPKGVKLVIGPDGRWYRLVAVAGPRGVRDQLHLAASPSDDVTDLVDPPPPA